MGGAPRKSGVSFENLNDPGKLYEQENIDDWDIPVLVSLRKLSRLTPL